jgi:hypothetical protein
MGPSKEDTSIELKNDSNSNRGKAVIVARLALQGVNRDHLS